MDALFKFMHPRTKHIQHATTSIDYEELRIWHLRLRQQARCEQLIKARCVSSWLVRISCHRHSFCQEVYARPVFYSRWRKKFLECLLGLRRLYYTLYTYVHKPLRYSSMSFTFETKWQRMWKDEYVGVSRLCWFWRRGESFFWYLCLVILLSLVWLPFLKLDHVQCL